MGAPVDLRLLLAAALDPSKCEGTANPWWFLFDPRGLAGRCMTYEEAVTTACLGVHGPFFSRDAADDYRAGQRHNLSGHEVVWCGSAHMSRDYRALLDAARADAPPSPSVDLVRDLVRGMEWWARQEDGIPAELWPVYARGKALLGEPVPDAPAE